MDTVAQGTHSLFSSVRIAWHALNRLEEEPALRIKELTTEPSWASELARRDVATAYALLNDTVKWKLFLDWHVSWACERLDLPLDDERSVHHGGLRNLLRLVTGAEKRVSSQRQRSDLHAALRRLSHEELPEAEDCLQAFSGLVVRADLDAERGCLGEERYLAVKYSHPEWMVRRWLARLPAHTVIDILETNNQRDPIVLRASLILVDSLIRLLRERGISARPANYHPRCVIIDNLRGHSLKDLEPVRRGLVQVQGEMPSFVVDILDPKDGDRILDMCCLPGTKTTYIAALINHGEIVSVDIRPRDDAAFQEMQRNLERLHLCENPRRRIKLISADGTTFDSKTRYDRILLDVPCSGLGILSRHADARWHRTEEEITYWASVQRELMSNCARLVKPGGKLVYSTCTIEPEENEGQIEWFLAEHGDFCIEDLSEYRIPSALLENNNRYYYPKKYAPRCKGKIQGGFAASIHKKT